MQIENVSALLAKHFREVHYGGNWTSVNLKEVLEDVSLPEALVPVFGCNTIAVLVFHMHYYVSAVKKVLEGAPLIAKDAESFEMPPLTSEEGWLQLKQQVWQDADAFALLVAALPEERLWEDFTDAKYGSYYRNLQGITEHFHYHLGQIVILKKIVRQLEQSSGQ